MTIEIPGRDIPDPEIEQFELNRQDLLDRQAFNEREIEEQKLSVAPGSFPNPSTATSPSISSSTFTPAPGVSANIGTDDFGASEASSTQLNQVPIDGELWRVGDQIFLVYFIPDSEPPIPLAYTVSEAELEELDPGGLQQIKTISEAEFRALGTLNQGPVGLLRDTTDNPWEEFFTDYENALFIMPWLEDPEFLAIYATAWLESRQPSLAEFAQTNFWQTTSQGERDWIVFVNSDPTSAGQVIDQNRRTVRDLMLQSGIEDPNGDLINFLSDKVTQGIWTQPFLQDQIRSLSDPFSGIPLSKEVADFVSSANLAIDTTRRGEDEVERLVNTWLGPHFASFWSDDAIARWAGEFRNDPDAQTELLEILKGQRLSLFPNFTNPNLTYEDIVAPMRGTFFNVWGQAADETDPFFLKLVNMNDLEAAERTLRQEGLSRGVRRVQNDALGSIVDAFGGGSASIRRADPAIL